MMDDIERLLDYGRMGLEMGRYEQAREDFEKVLALDPSNREARKGLARVNEILSRREAAAVKPIQHKPVKPLRKVATTNKAVYGLAAILVLVVVVTLAWMAYIMFIEPPREASLAPTVVTIHTGTPNPTTTLKPLPTPTELTETGFTEPWRKQIFNDLLDDRGSIAGEEVRAATAQRWGISVDAAKEIVAEGIEKGWLPTATPMAPTLVPPTATPDWSAVEEAYLSQFYEIIGIYEDSSHDFALLEQEIFSGFQLGGITGWDSRFEVVDEMVRQTGERVQGLEVPARYERVHQELEQASQHVQGASNALLTGAREQARYLDTWDRDSDEYSHLHIEQARQKLALASESMMRAKLEQQLALPTTQMSYAEIAYLRAVGDAPVCFTNAEGVIKLLMREMARNPYIRGDRSWQKDMAAAKVLFLECLNRLRELNPPPRLTDVHSGLVRCGNLYFSAAYDDYRLGIEELWPEAIEYGDEAMKQGADCFEQAFDEIDEILGL